MEIKINTQSFDDREMMNDALISQKSLTKTYSIFADECSTPGVRNEFLSILSEEHQIQADVFDEMSKRGWYQIPPAEQTKIDQAKQKFSSMG